MQNGDLAKFIGIALTLTAIQIAGDPSESHVSTDVSKSSVSETTVSNNSISNNSISILSEQYESIKSIYIDVCELDSNDSVPKSNSPNFTSLEVVEPIPDEQQSRISIEKTVEAADSPTYVCDQYQVYVYDICSQYDNVPPELILAMIEKESGGDASITGGHGTYLGLMQINPKYQVDRMEALGVTDLLDAESNIKVGVDFMSKLLEDHNGNVAVALMRYNGDTRAYESGYVSGYAKHIMKRANKISISVSDYFDTEAMNIPSEAESVSENEVIGMIDEAEATELSPYLESFNSVSDNCIDL